MTQSYILEIEKSRNNSIEVDTEPIRGDPDYIHIRVEDFAGSLGSPSQMASIYLSPEEAAQLVTHILRDEAVVKAVAFPNKKG